MKRYLVEVQYTMNGIFILEAESDEAANRIAKSVPLKDTNYYEVYKKIGYIQKDWIGNSEDEVILRQSLGYEKIQK